MADDSTTTITAVFETREAAELAVEHLVQQHDISRPDVFVQSASDRNTTGTQASRGDLKRGDAPHAGEIEVSADIPASLVPAVQRSFSEVGAIRVSGL